METAPLTRVAVYRRRLPVCEERVWENVHDWEHLPWLHRSSFHAIELVESGDWGWKAWIGLQPASVGQQLLIELVCDGDRYVSRTLEGGTPGSEIWTRVTSHSAEVTDVEVEFLVPGVEPESREALGRAYTALYTTLWNEDEAMMTRRSSQLRGRTSAESGGPAKVIGSLADVREKLPLCFEVGGRAWRIVEVDGELIAHGTLCPHLLGPLEDAPVENGTIRCPWHGYRFDLRDGKNCDGHRLRLPKAPRVEVDAASDEVRIVPAA